MDAIRGDIRTAEFPLTGAFLAGRLREHLGADDLQYIENLVATVEDHRDGTRLLKRGAVTDHSTILIEGYVLRIMEAGGKRYILGVNVPGDFVDLHGFALKRLDHNVDAAGAIKVGRVSHASLQKVMRDRPRIARAMWFATLLDASIDRKWIQILEQLDAPKRIAHLFAEVQTRLKLIGRDAPRALRTPFTQIDLADMCGVSAIHANRAVGKMRELGIAEIRRGDLFTDDWDRLKRYARFEPDYLYGDGALKFDEVWD